jgi:hypothetical protein
MENGDGVMVEVAPGIVRRHLSGQSVTLSHSYPKLTKILFNSLIDNRC